MFKTEFISLYATKNNCTKGEAEKRINEFFDTIIESCLTEGFVQITGYGTFEYKYTAEREATNPKTGEKVVVAPKSSIRFKPGKKMKDF